MPAVLAAGHFRGKLAVLNGVFARITPALHGQVETDIGQFTLNFCRFCPMVSWSDLFRAQ
jgi:hypothetical protein